ncbi:MAG: DUF1080 domain-containing protein [Planctomycetaceae bacterium]|nr:DUF1080 domain-containing protein [Planctomycetaceae bacterium]
MNCHLFSVFLTLSVVSATLADEKAKTNSLPNPDQTARTNKLILFDGESLKGWRIIKTFDFKDHGPVQVKNKTITLGKGAPATGISWKGELPRSNYEISLQAKRTEGDDFFCGLTFPVKKDYCSLIVGGWGGQVVGLSNLDDFSAIENETTQVVEFEQDKWYPIRLRVTDDRITIHIDKKKLIDIDTQHKFSIWWEQDPVTPLGIVTWNTAGSIKDLKIKRVDKARSE